LFCGFWLNNKYDVIENTDHCYFFMTVSLSQGPLSEDERRAEIHKQKLLLFDRDSERRTRVFDDQADYFSTETEAWLDPAELEARRKLRAEAEAARQRQRSTLTVTFDFAGRQVVSHAADADRAALDKRFGVAEQPQSQGDAEIEKRLAAELDAVERVKLLSMAGKDKAAPAPAAAVALTKPAAAAAASAAPVAPLRIKPSDNIEMRPIALAREHAAPKKGGGEQKTSKANGKAKAKNHAAAIATGKNKHDKVQSEHDELF
jgi:hypothetical protein